MEETETNESNQPVPPNTRACPDCGLSFKTAQGLAGHRRLGHSASTVRYLEARAQELNEQEQGLETKSVEIARREETARRREAEVARRKWEIEETGPSSIGLNQCRDCGAWFDDSDTLRTHARSVHPLDEKVAVEVGIDKKRVNDVWAEACYKQKRHPDETTERIVKRFWSATDQKILRLLLDHNAAFKFEGEE